jgi:hypothetical protein
MAVDAIVVENRLHSAELRKSVARLSYARVSHAGEKKSGILW